jgi:hypothetical protein
MSANTTETTQASAKIAPAAQDEASPGVPKKITNAQTVCNEKNEKGKLCNGHLKQTRTGGEQAAQHLRGDDVLFKCQFCGTLYMGPPLGHVRDPYKQQRFVERELTAILQAAGGTLPSIVKNEKGAYVLAEAQAAHAPAAKPAAPTTGAATPPTKTAQPTGTATQKASTGAATGTVAQPATAAAPTPAAKPAGEPKVARGYVPPPAPGPVPGETPEQKLARLRAIVAEAKRRKAAADADAGDEPEPAAAPASVPTSAPASTVQTQPAVASTSGTDSSAQADEQRPAAEAQAATGQASAVPLNPSAANASPAALEQQAASHGTPGRAAFDTGPVPGETHEQKITRLRLVVNAARELAGKPPKY